MPRTTSNSQQSQQQREAEEAAQRERERVAAIQNQINELNILQNSYIIAKQDIEHIQENSERTVQEWKEKNSTLSTQVNDIYRVNEFEGEIAQRLSQYAIELLQVLSEGANKGEQLTYALNRQVNVINNRIGDIESQISRLRSQI